MIVDDTHVILSHGELEALPNYAMSVPTASDKSIGKRWRRPLYDGREIVGWMMGEFEPDPEPGFIRIRWRRVLEVVSGKAVVS